MKRKPSRYEDILYLPRPVSKTRKRMSQYDRAAQFSPFAALVGYDAAIREAARLTSGGRELVAQHREERPRVEVTWFREDERKAGGEYVTSRGILTAVSAQGQWLELDREMRIRFGDIFALESPVFREE